MSDGVRTSDQSVPYGDDEAILEAFRRDGYCVVTGILSEDETSEILNELWTSERLLGKFDRGDPKTWADPRWPQQDGKGGRNFLASTNVYQDAAPWDLASSDKLLHVQQLLYGRDDIMKTSMGRWGIMRPTRDHPEWQTESSWLHWDQNAWTQPGFFRVQCIVCLTDNTATSGGFACVPGFHHRFKAWGGDHPQGSLVVNGKVIDETYGAGQPFPVPLDDPCQEQVVRVLAPAGAAVLWDSRLPHQNFPNTSNSEFRVVHYCMMKPKDDESAKDRRRLLTQKRILMDLLGEEGLRFPHRLNATGRFVHCLDNNGQQKEAPSLSDALQSFNATDENALREAAGLVREAGVLEEQGETSAAIKKHQRSLVLFPDIEKWHEAIFG